MANKIFRFEPGSRYADQLKKAARAEKEANQLRNQALTPAVLEKMWIEKWDGKLPVYGQVPTIFKDISK